MKLKTKRTTSRIASILVVLLLVFSPSGCQSYSPTSQVPKAAPTPSGTPPAPVNKPEIPYELISQESLFAYLEDLTTIQAYSGWRNSASRGEAEALEYVKETLSAFSYLQEQGLELERQSFHVYLSTEIRDTSLTLTVNRTGNTNTEVSVKYTTVNGTATAGSDYTADYGTLTFTNGQVSQTIELTLTDDALQEGNETFSVRLSNANHQPSR